MQACAGLFHGFQTLFDLAPDLLLFFLDMRSALSQMIDPGALAAQRRAQFRQGSIDAVQIRLNPLPGYLELLLSGAALLKLQGELTNHPLPRPDDLGQVFEFLLTGQHAAGLVFAAAQADPVGTDPESIRSQYRFPRPQTPAHGQRLLQGVGAMDVPQKPLQGQRRLDERQQLPCVRHSVVRFPRAALEQG